MAVDEAILRVHSQGKTLPTLRVYEWSRATLSVGRFQPLGQLNLIACQEREIDIVRRPTGGRAVLHHDEVTYSVVTSKRFGIPNKIKDSYIRLCQGLIAAYRRFGICLEIGGNRMELHPVCFATSTFADLTYRGKKMIGSAQVWVRGSVLQHGSLLISLDPSLLVSLFQYPSDVDFLAEVQALKDKTLSLSKCLNPPPIRREIKAAVKAGFQEAFGEELVDSELLPDEIELAEQILNERSGKIGI
jgi:lipoate-protein ligase A